MGRIGHAAAEALSLRSNLPRRIAYSISASPACRGFSLPEPYGGHEFLIAYYAALAGKPQEIGASRTLPRSMNALIVAYYGSPDFKGLRAQAPRASIAIFWSDSGSAMATTTPLGMKATNVRKLMNEKAETPDAANRLLGLLSILMETAIALGWRDDNPAFGVKRLKHRSGGIRDLAEADIQAYRDFYPLGSRERLVLELAIGTAQRHRGSRPPGWRYVIKGAIALKQNKTGATVTVPIVPELRATLDLCPHDP